MSSRAHSRVFWSGGSQAVRLPKAMRLRAAEVTIERRGKALLIVPVEDADGWGGFWDRLLTVKASVRRHKTRPVERRKPL
jgi:virulence-associated protein VagC